MHHWLRVMDAPRSRQGRSQEKIGNFSFLGGVFPLILGVFLCTRMPSLITGMNLFQVHGVECRVIIRIGFRDHESDEDNYQKIGGFRDVDITRVN